MKRLLLLVTLLATGVSLIPAIGDPVPVGASGIIAGRVQDGFQPTDGKLFVLVIGNDAREGNPDNARADAIHILGINTKTKKGGILNFPRDSYVPLAGGGTGRINEALVRGGPEAVARTLQNLTGIQIDLWVMTGFEGFRDLVSEIGRVTMKIPEPINDPLGSGAKLKKGTYPLGPLNALAFVRTRKTIAGGDIGRTTNQGRFMLAMLAEYRKDTKDRPGIAFRWIAAIEKYTRLDVDPAELFRLSILARRVEPKDVANVTVPVSLGQVGAASVVFIQGGARSIYARFKRNASL
jgi:polyisoprenyl-teichoic acid--peptidoglycan teichoic acid transferase